MSAVYTYEVKMIITVIEKNPEAARVRLDAQGGWSHHREVTPLSVIEIPVEDDESVVPR